MKQRIIALVLVVVMALLSLTSCKGSFNFAEENLSSYAEFDAKAFNEALLKLEIEDGDFTTNEDTRAQKVLENIYDSIATAIVKASYESDRKTEGTLGKGDVLYFVYYAVDEATGNVYFTSEMKESSITASSTSANHVINLGHVADDKEFLQLIKDNTNFEGDLKDYAYNMLTSDEITAQVKADTLAANKDATTEQIDAAVAAALKVKAGDTVYISYTRTYTKVDAEGKESTVTETANFEKVTFDAENEFHKLFLHEKTTAKIGGTAVSFYNEAEDKNSLELKYTIDGVEYTYSSVKILWKVENEGKAIATFKYTPYEATQNVAPDNCVSTGKTDLKNVELTYYVYPVYALTAPACDEIDVLDILVHLYGSKLTKTSFKVLEEEGYKNGEETVADLIGEITKIYGKKDEAYYGEGKALKSFLDALDAANKAVAGDKATTAEQEVIDAATEALTKAQNAEAEKIFVKIIEAKKDDKVLGTEIFEEYEHDIYHTLKEEYDALIIEKIEAAIWKLIDESVKVTGYPQEVIDEYYEVLYESYEYKFHTGDFSTSLSNFKKYNGSFEAYLIATLKVNNASEIEGALLAEVKSYIDPIIKVFVVAQALNDIASAKVVEYVEADIKAEVYEGEDTIEQVREESKYFLVDDAYLKYYKKEVGRSYYRNLIDSYGEINIRAGIQFSKLFNYLTSVDVEMNDEDGEDHAHAECKYTDADAEGNIYLSFRTVKYTIVVPTEETETETETDSENN